MSASTALRRGPFLHSGVSSRDLARWTVLAALPACAGAVWSAGWPAALLLGSSIAAAWLMDALAKRRVAPHEATLLTGISFALMMPRGAPWWLAAAGGALAVLVAKHGFGGQRRNLFNPSAFARVALMVALPAYFLAPAATDGISGATPLAKEFGATQLSLAELLRGDSFGSLAQAWPMAVAAGGLLLVALRVADWRVPLAYLTSVALCATLLPVGPRVSGHAPWLAHDVATHLLAGGTLLAAFFLLTDPVTSPISRRGRIAFAALAGLVTIVVRFYTPYPDGAALAVLAANAAAPALDRWPARVA